MIKEIVVKAYTFAEEAHGEAVRKFSGLPYFTHVKFVARTLDDLHCEPDIVAAGFLHDLIEDTTITYEQILNEFGKRIADLVKGVSNNEEDMKAAGGKRLYLAKKIAEMDEGCLTIKLADRYHNVLFLEHDSTPKEFIEKYYKETKFILFALEQTDKILTEVQSALIKRIEAILEFLRIRYFLK